MAIIERLKRVSFRQLMWISVISTLLLLLVFFNFSRLELLFGVSEGSSKTAWFASMVSVFLVSFVSLVGITTLGMNIDRLKKIVIFLVSLAAGTLLGDVMIHLLPEVVEESGFGLSISLYILLGIIVFFILEKFIHWHHCHMPQDKKHVHSFAWVNLFGDGLHNFIDGLIIGGSYLVSLPVGIATTLAVLIHEIPQEIGDFGVLIHGGFTRGKALAFNFLTALTAVLGTILALVLGAVSEGFTTFIIPFTIGGFIYIAVADLIPELHKETDPRRSLLQVLGIIIGIGAMILLTLLE